MQRRWLITLAIVGPALLFTANSGAAEIYTFGKRGDGSRFVRQVDRPMERRADAEANNAKPASQTPVRSSLSRPNGASTGRVPPPLPRELLPPPIPNAQALQLLDQPI